MKKNILATSIIFWGISAFAVDLPQIQKPQELATGEFAEGTLTALSAADVKEYLPWANNAKKLLEDALTESKRLTLIERKAYLENEIKSVVRESAPKKYQMLMRFALNRGLLLSDIIAKDSNQNDPGVIQNELSVLMAAIKTSFEFYESDIEFQKKVSEGSGSVLVPQALLGFKIASAMLDLAPSIFDASAQFQFMRKTFEILNWDLSQDQDSKRYAEAIVDIHKVTSKLPANAKNDEEAIKHVRSLYYLKQKLKDHFSETSSSNYRLKIYNGMIELGKGLNYFQAEGQCRQRGARLPSKNEAIRYNFKLAWTTESREGGRLYWILGGNPDYEGFHFNSDTYINTICIR